MRVNDLERLMNSLSESSHLSLQDVDSYLAQNQNSNIDKDIHLNEKGKSVEKQTELTKDKTASIIDRLIETQLEKPTRRGLNKKLRI